jgi:hypothetical protein
MLAVATVSPSSLSRLILACLAKKADISAVDGSSAAQGSMMAVVDSSDSMASAGTAANIHGEHWPTCV